MEFEYNPAKSTANRDKHGIDFEAAQMLWDDRSGIVIGPRVGDETRWMWVGQLHGRFWAAVYTERGARVRLISVRRARQKEIERYERAKRKD